MAHVPKYILAKAKRLSKKPANSEKLVKEITHWLRLSGVPYADLKPYTWLVESLYDGKFQSDEEIKKGFDRLMDE